MIAQRVNNNGPHFRLIAFNEVKMSSVNSEISAKFEQQQQEQYIAVSVLL